MNSKKTDDTWRLVEEKKEVLLELVEEKWKNEDWELAALCERTLRTIEQSKETVDILKAKAEALKLQLGIR